ncbi:MAG: nucleoside recognition protein, partial [Clostridiaceae bacterium]|nr:nucleoside recognition protein [Clostridiaceae bacterium]
MLNYIWLGMLLSGIILGIMNGRISEVTKAVIESSGSAIKLGISLAGIMCLWSGIMKIAEESGLVKSIAMAVKPVLKFLFPGIPRNHPALGAVVMNLAANILGLGNAATPLGLKAMAELQELNPLKYAASDEIVMFLVLNASSLQLVPASVIAIRSQAGSANP